MEWNQVSLIMMVVDVVMYEANMNVVQILRSSMHPCVQLAFDVAQCPPLQVPNALRCSKNLPSRIYISKEYQLLVIPALIQ